LLLFLFDKRWERYGVTAGASLLDHQRLGGSSTGTRLPQR
jgi:hypothetical protein